MEIDTIRKKMRIIFSLGVIEMDRIREKKKCIRVTVQVRRFGDRVKESRCRGEMLSIQEGKC